MTKCQNLVDGCLSVMLVSPQEYPPGSCTIDSGDCRRKLCGGTDCTAFFVVVVVVVVVVAPPARRRQSGIGLVKHHRLRRALGRCAAQVSIRFNSFRRL